MISIFSFVGKMHLISVTLIALGVLSAYGQEVKNLGDIAYRNILNLKNRDEFAFTVFPDPGDNGSNGDAKHVADEKQKLYGLGWPAFGIQAKADQDMIAFLQVDLKRPYYVRAFAVTGYPHGGYKPTGPFFLEGSEDGLSWKMVAEGKASQWHAPGTYPFRADQIIKAQYPNKYQHYRVIARGWENGHMMIYNWGLYV